MVGMGSPGASSAVDMLHLIVRSVQRHSRHTFWRPRVVSLKGNTFRRHTYTDSVQIYRKTRHNKWYRGKHSFKLEHATVPFYTVN
jgi:hypothetical protein